MSQEPSPEETLDEAMQKVTIRTKRGREDECFADVAAATVAFSVPLSDWPERPAAIISNHISVLTRLVVVFLIELRNLLASAGIALELLKCETSRNDC